MKRLAMIAIWLPVVANAHTGNRLFSIPYVSVDDLAHIEMDGDVADWKDLLGEPTVTPLDFHMFSHQALSSYDQYDPGNLDFRVWIAWGDEGKLYVAAEAADDVYRSDEFEYVFYTSDHVSLKVDGDHSGGQFIFLGNAATRAETADPRSRRGGTRQGPSVI